MTTTQALPGIDLDLDKQRALFEAGELDSASNLTRQADGQYENPCTQSAWEGWQNALIAQARAAQPAPVSPAGQQAEPIYMVAATFPGSNQIRHWYDTTKAIYDEHKPEYRRVYAAPVAGQQAAPAQQAGEAPTIEQIADAVSRLIGAHVVDWTSHHDEEDEPFSSDAHERAHLCDMIRKYATTPAPTAADTTASASERAAFEVWATITGPWAECFLTLMWDAWQARATLAPVAAQQAAAVAAPSESALKSAIITACENHETEMEGYSYFGSNPGVPKDRYDEVADEVIAAMRATQQEGGNA